MRVVGWGAVALLSVIGGLACGRYTDYCLARVNCQHGNDADVAACEVDKRREAELADAYGCSAQFDTFENCLEAKVQCKDSVFALPADQCNEHTRDYENCMK